MTRSNFYIKYLLSALPALINSIICKKNKEKELALTTTSPVHLINFLKLSSFFEVACLNDICVVDNPQHDKKRFELCYNLLSVKQNFRFFIKTCVNSQVVSLTSLYNSANWLEREA
jgi:NADH:ubiquinone oxidoreductase subunit C